MCTILFIDDEPIFAQNYIDALQDEGHEVNFQKKADRGLHELRHRIAEIDLLILDFMMPTPPGVSSGDTMDGAATGRWFLSQARESLEDRKLPVIVLTNKATDWVTSQITEYVILTGVSFQVLHKPAISASLLPGIVRDFMTDPRN